MSIADPNVDALAEAFLLLKNKAEAKRFMRDLMTEQELNDLALRWKVARGLDDGETYVQIEEQTGLSSATIARISRWLNEGTGGYRLLLDRRKK